VDYWQVTIFKRTSTQRETVETIIILSILNFALEQWSKYVGVKYISSGLGAIINAIFQFDCDYHFF
jgi:hypothetical protein